MNFYIYDGITGLARQRTHSSSRSDDEIETSLSDELNTSWPVVSNKKSKVKKARSSLSVVHYGIHVASEFNNNNNVIPVHFNGTNNNKQASRKSRRKRERERFGGTKKGAGFGGVDYVRSNINGTILAERPKTATLKRPSILDESLKDKVNNKQINKLKINYKYI